MDREIVIRSMIGCMRRRMECLYCFIVVGSLVQVQESALNIILVNNALETNLLTKFLYCYRVSLAAIIHSL